MSHMAISTRIALRAAALAFSGALVLTGGWSGQASGVSSPAKAGSATKVTVTMTEFELKLSRKSFTPGTYTFTADNAGKTVHALVIVGPGVKGAHTKTIKGGQKATVTVKLKKGSYELFCPVDNHKQLGMDTHIRVK